TVPPAFCPLVSTMSPYSTISLSFYSSRSPPHPHPFPTRRSSDLPIDKAFDAFFHGHLRPIPHRSGQRRDIGLGIRHITRLQRQQIHFRLAAKTLFQHFDIAQQFHGLFVADIEQPVWSDPTAGRIWRIAAPVRVLLRRRITRAHHAFHNIVDISEAAPMMAMVEYLDRLAGKNRLGEQE